MLIFFKIASNRPSTNPITATAMISGIAAMIKARSGVNSDATSVRIGPTVSLSAPALTDATVRNIIRHAVSSVLVRAVSPDFFSFSVSFTLWSVFDIITTKNTEYKKVFQFLTPMIGHEKEKEIFSALSDGFRE